jgi:hypothetical protein
MNLAQPRQNAKPVKAWQIEIEYDEIGQTCQCHLQPLNAIMARTRTVPATTQGTGDMSSQPRFVFDYQNAHTRKPLLKPSQLASGPSLKTAIFPVPASLIPFPAFIGGLDRSP